MASAPSWLPDDNDTAAGVSSPEETQSSESHHEGPIAGLQPIATAAGVGLAMPAGSSGAPSQTTGETAPASSPVVAPESPNGSSESPPAGGNASDLPPPPPHETALSSPAAEAFGQFVLSILGGGSPMPPASVLDQMAQSPIQQFLHSFLLPDAESAITPHTAPLLPHSFNAVAFVDSLEEVDMSSISAADNKCPHCWLPFGTTDADDPEYVPDAPESEEQAAALAMFAELPFDNSKVNNDPVRTPCGHIFGRTCLIDSLTKVGTMCPKCRAELIPAQEETDTEDEGDEEEAEDFASYLAIMTGHGLFDPEGFFDSPSEESDADDMEE